MTSHSQFERDMNDRRHGAAGRNVPTIAGVEAYTQRARKESERGVIVPPPLDPKLFTPTPPIMPALVQQTTVRAQEETTVSVVLKSLFVLSAIAAIAERSLTAGLMFFVAGAGAIALFALLYRTRSGRRIIRTVAICAALGTATVAITAVASEGYDVLTAYLHNATALEGNCGPVCSFSVPITERGE